MRTWPCPSRARFLGHDEDDHARVPRRVAGLSALADLPLATDAKRDFLDRAPAQVWQRDDDDLAAGLRANVGDDSLDRVRRSAPG